jgi:hypothetical protein
MAVSSSLQLCMFYIIASWHQQQLTIPCSHTAEPRSYTALQQMSCTCVAAAQVTRGADFYIRLPLSGRLYLRASESPVRFCYQHDCYNVCVLAKACTA